MTVQILCGIALCFLGVGLMNAEVIQITPYMVKRRGEKVLLECFQNMNHERMYWYRQDPGLGLQLIYFSYDVDNNEEGEVSEGYSVSRKKREHFFLTLESASTNQTSVYHCASSTATALHSHILSAQKEQIQEETDPKSELMLAPMAHVCLWGKWPLWSNQLRKHASQQETKR